MRVAYLTAGAGDMFCGSCLRDNTLAAALRRMGRDLLLIPLYSPIRTDEENVSEYRVYYGGINVYLEQKSALFRHAPRFISRMLSAPGLLRKAMKRAGEASPELLGELTVSVLRGEHGAQRGELDVLIDALRQHQVDLVHLPDALFVGLAEAMRERLRVPVVCTLTGEDILLDKLRKPHRDEALRLIRQAAPDVDTFIAVTRYYAGYAVEHFGIDPARIRHVPLGIRVDYESDSERMSFEPGSDVFTLGYMARICPEKGLHVLAQAFTILRREGRECRLKIGGYLAQADRSYEQDVRRILREAKVEDHVEFDGELDREGKMRLLRSLDVLSVPTLYREAKGLYVLEALSQGVPVVQPRHGSFPELIEATGGGLLVEPEDFVDLARAIARLMDDPSLRRKLGHDGQRVVTERFTDECMAGATWNVFEDCLRAFRATPRTAPNETSMTGAP